MLQHPALHTHSSPVSLQTGFVNKSQRALHSSMESEENIVWIDMELTGLDPMKDHILEISCVVTDGNLNTIDEHPSLVIHHPSSVLENMNEWCKIHHGQSMLVTACLESKLSLQEAEHKILGFIKKYAPPRKCPLGGNTVYMDRLFLREHMPSVEKYLHYRIIDVSTIKELCMRWFPLDFKAAPVKTFQHRAQQDIRESIEELQYYKSLFQTTYKGHM